MIGVEGAGLAGAPSEVPELRLTAHMYERVHGAAPAAVRRVHGGLTLLGGPGAALALALPWGVVVAAGASPDGGAALYSMNRHTDAFAAGHGGLPAALAAGTVPPWAAPAVAALLAHADPAPGARLVVNRELPAEMALLTGAETACAVSLVLGDLHGPPSRPPGARHEPSRDPAYAAALHARDRHAVLVEDGAGGEGGEGGEVRHLPCDLAAAGLRLLIMDVAGGGDPAPPDGAAPELVRRGAAALRTGNLDELGPLLTEAHTDLGTPLDTALAAARAAGALGGRALGRCGVALVPMAAVPAVRAEVTARLAGRIRRPPRFLTAVPAGV
ncbi:hypothetical protein [Actinomadura parmotrematis]|uniref:Galactokinase n=1 Tax=Actinomadura parmotrematis TaxID=2864039 RepID=A0ABS7FWY0_9ACTN|nr:hypothetical protein [Actinomadura parmotrematis]MBW8484781.1 hypothetical protein [Actinomadura parmotrematis]